VVLVVVLRVCKLLMKSDEVVLVVLEVEELTVLMLDYSR
jgi:hypothetical protein